MNGLRAINGRSPSPRKIYTLSTFRVNNHSPAFPPEHPQTLPNRADTILVTSPKIFTEHPLPSPTPQRHRDLNSNPLLSTPVTVSPKLQTRPNNHAYNQLLPRQTSANIHLPRRSNLSSPMNDQEQSNLTYTHESPSNTLTVETGLLEPTG